MIHKYRAILDGNLLDSPFIILDLETTGGNPEKNKVPSNIFYLNVVGTRLGNGLASNPALKQIQNTIRASISGFGANDGFVEYPDAVIPNSWFDSKFDLRNNNLTLALNTSHAIGDGSFRWQNYELDLRSISERLVFYESFLLSLADQIHL